MENSVSIFIMDVTDSTSGDNWEELSEYLEEIEQWIRDWTNQVAASIVKHRQGDEIIFIGEHYSTAYIIASYVSRIWKFKKHPPYFGIAFGNIDKRLDKIDIETWNHPLIKKAKMASEKIKQSNKRQPILFNFEKSLIETGSADPELKNSISNYFKEYGYLINLLLEMQSKLVTDQTEQQKLICFLYSVFEEQKKIATFLSKTPGTISSHYKKGNVEIVLKTQERIQKSLNMFEGFSYKGNLDFYTEKLHKSIKNHMREQLIQNEVI